MTDPYQPRLPSRLSRLAVRGVPYQLREWGDPGARKLVLLHGARDASASFQFLVDALGGGWHVMAPDWRGHGGSGWTVGSYWQAEFMADLDVLLDTLSPGAAVPLIGHSMGGNVASLYAGMRPGRVASLVMLDALGDLLHRTPVKVVEILNLMLDAKNAGANERGYPAPSDLASRLMRANHRLSPAKAAFLGAAHARRLANDSFGWPYDPSFKRSYPTMQSSQDWGSVWCGITAPVLQVMSSDTRPHAPASDPEVAATRRGFFRNLQVATIPETGHNLHHDAPEAVAAMIGLFLAAPWPEA